MGIVSFGNHCDSAREDFTVRPTVCMLACIRKTFRGNITVGHAMERLRILAEHLSGPEGALHMAWFY